VDDDPMIGLAPSIALDLPPWPYDAIVDGQPVMLRPGPDGTLVGHVMLELEENPQPQDNIGATGVPFAYVLTVKAQDRLVLRSSFPDQINTARSIRSALRASAAKKSTVVFTDPEQNNLTVAVRDLQEHRLAMAQPAWDLVLTLVLRDPVTS
jgi:hypothetical protein